MGLRLLEDGRLGDESTECVSIWHFVFRFDSFIFALAIVIVLINKTQQNYLNIQLFECCPLSAHIFISNFPKSINKASAGMNELFYGIHFLQYPSSLLSVNRHNTN